MKLYEDLAEYYFAIESNHREIADDIAFIRTHLNGKDPSKLLDLGCGTGEHLGMLTKFGAVCSGIDASPRMIQIAKKRNPEKITFSTGRINYFDYYEEFDIITCLFGTFNYMLTDADVDSCLWSAFRALKSNGICIFEIWNSIPFEKIRHRDLSHVSTTKYNDITIERERGFSIPDPSKPNMVEVNFNYDIIGPKGTSSVRDRHVMRTFSYPEITKHLNANGFRVAHVYSNFIKEPLQERSSRIILVFSKE